MTLSKLKAHLLLLGFTDNTALYHVGSRFTKGVVNIITYPISNSCTISISGRAFEELTYAAMIKKLEKLYE